MIADIPSGPMPEQTADLDAELRHFGIRRVRADSFEVNGFRYTHAQDAIAEVKRHPNRSIER